MTLEMGQDDGEVVVCIVRAYDVIRYVASAFHRKPGFALGIHDVHFSNGGEAVVFGGLEMGGGVGASVSVSRIAFHDSSFHTLYEVFNQ